MDWKVSGDYAESCNCDVLCPCIFLQPASMGPCNAMLVWDIKQGHCDDVKLDGVKVSAYLEAGTENLTDGNCTLASISMKTHLMNKQQRLKNYGADKVEVILEL